MSEERVPAPPALAEILRDKDTIRIAKEVFAVMDDARDERSLRPKLIPEPTPFRDQDLLKRWRLGQATIPDDMIGAFAAWLENAKLRSEVIAENERRLRVTLWAHVRLRYVADYGARFAAWHKNFWGIAVVPDNYNERETLVKDRARSGRPWGHK